MNLPIILAIGSSLFFGTVAVVFSLWEEKRKHLFLEQKRTQRFHQFELSFMRKLQEHIGTTLSAKDITDILLSSLEYMLPKATAAYILCDTEPHTCHLLMKHDLGRKYYTALKEHMINSLQSLDVPIHLPLDEPLMNTEINETDLNLPRSIFSVPLAISSDQVVGIVTISSSDVHAFTQEDMETVYRVMNHALALLSRLTHHQNLESNKLMAMIKSLREGAFMVDPGNNIIVSNEKTRELLGIAKTEPTLLDIMNVLPGGVNFVSKLERSMHDQVVIEEHNLKIHDKVLEMTISPVTSGNHIVGAAVLLHDVTAEKSVAQMKEDFTNIMVHELRSPLTAMKASSQLLIAKDDAFTAEERKKLLQVIKEQSQKLLDEVSMILDAAKLQSGLFTVQKTPGDIQKLINESVDFFTPQAQAKYITLKTEVEPLPEFSFDQRYIALVLNNLISNSMKFTNVGGVITVTAKKDQNHVIFSVSDTGIGIPKEKQSVLFSKFTQIVTPSAHVGTGLGLYIVKGIIDAHGGKVSLDSEPGHGTTITATLPLTSQPIDTPLPPHPVFHGPMLSQARTPLHA